MTVDEFTYYVYLAAVLAGAASLLFLACKPVYFVDTVDGLGFGKTDPLLFVFRFRALRCARDLGRRARVVRMTQGGRTTVIYLGRDPLEETRR